MVGGLRTLGKLPWRAALSWVLLALFALRSLIPAGYMPQVNLAGDDTIQVVICTGYGFKTITVDAQGQPVEEHGKESAQSDDCQFGTTLSKAFLPNEQLAAPWQPRLSAHVVASRDEALPPPANGPPLGSRAPPVIPG